MNYEYASFYLFHFVYFVVKLFFNKKDIDMNDLSKLAGQLNISGKKVIPSGIMPGPMEGVMTPLLCKALAALGLVDFWITPFIRITTGVPKLSTIRRKFSQFTDDGLPTIVQLMGNDVDRLALTALQVKKLDMLGVNMNFACPSKRVLSNDGGGNQLKTPQVMHNILRKMKSEVGDYSVSAKLRVGFDDHSEMEDIIPAICESGVDFLMLHFRTVKESYKSVEQGMERLARAVELAGDIPLIGSGDIFTPQDAANMHKVSGCAGITVARGLLRNPFLIREIQEYFVTGSFETTEQHKITFYDTLIGLAREEPSRYWIRPNFLELAKHLWGTDCAIFNRLKTMDRDQLFALSSTAELLG